MTAPHDKIPVDVWQKLMLGQLSDVELDALAARLASTDDVEANCQTLALPDDTLLTLLRGRQPQADPALDDLTQRLLAKVHAARSADISATQSHLSQPSTDTYIIDAPAAMPAQLEHFQLLKQLGQGGMGAVYLAHDTRLNRDVAIKTLRPELAEKKDSRERFLREARAAAALNHDYILTIYHVGEDQGIPYLAMPVLEGTGLKELLHTKGRLPLADVLRYGRQIALGLAAAHARGMIHRDVKPANIWIEPTDGGRVKLLDFGLAHRVTDAHLTASGAIVGTPSYMAPEQARSQKVDHRADLFSLGVVLYEMCWGHRPFSGTDAVSVLMSIAIDTPQPLHTLDATIPKGLSDLIMQLLDKNPDQRPATAQEVAERLLALQVQTSIPLVEAVQTANTSATASPADPWANIDDTESLPPVVTPKATSSPKATKRLRPWLVLAACLLLVVVGGGLAAYKLVFESKDGTLVVEVDGDADVRFKNGELRVHDADGKLKYTLKPGTRNQKMPAGAYTVQVVSADGVKLDTDKFEMSKDGQVVLRVTADPRAVAKKADPVTLDADRKAAEWVLSVGGAVWINDQEQEITTKAALPKDAFRLTGIIGLRSEQVTDDSLKVLQSCKHITIVDLHGAKNLTDNGVTSLGHVAQFRELNLGYTQVSDKGLAVFSQCKNLRNLDLTQTAVTDAGLLPFRECKQLQVLQIDRTKITAKGLEVFKDHSDFKMLYLNSIGLTDEGLAHFKNSKGIERLFLDDARISDKGLEQIGGYAKLDHLDLNNTPTTDIGLVHLKNLPNLKGLGLNNTKVTDVGLAHLKVHKNLHGIGLHNTGVTDAGIGHLFTKELGGLSGIELDGTQISDDALAILKGIRATRMSFTNTRITDKGLLHFQGKELQQLYVNKTALSDASVPVLMSIKGLQRLEIQGTKITPAGIEKLKAGLPKCHLVTDAGEIPPRTEPQPAVATESQRQAMVAVLKLGGSLLLLVEGKEVLVKQPADLPKQAALLHTVDLGSVKAFDDRRIEVLKDLPPITHGLYISNTSVTHQGLVKLATYPSVARLRRFNIPGLQIVGEQFAVFGQFKTVENLRLNVTPIKDADLVHLRALPLLRALDIDGNHEQITDQGLLALAEIKGLTYLNVKRTKVTKAGIEKLATALPRCEIDWDGGNVKPRVK